MFSAILCFNNVQSNLIDNAISSGMRWYDDIGTTWRFCYSLDEIFFCCSTAISANTLYLLCIYYETRHYTVNQKNVASSHTVMRCTVLEIHFCTPVRSSSIFQLNNHCLNFASIIRIWSSSISPANFSFSYFEEVTRSRPKAIYFKDAGLKDMVEQELRQTHRNNGNYKLVDLEGCKSLYAKVLV